MNRLTFAALFVCLVAHAEPAPREPPKRVAPLTVALVVGGPQTDEGKVKGCQEVFTDAGATLDPSAPLVVRLQLGNNFNHLTIELFRRGRLLDEPKPDWRVKVLCRDALASVVQLMTMDPQVRAAASAPPPPPARLGLDVNGPEADFGKLEKCQKIFAEGGVVVDNLSPVHVQLFLGNGRNRVTIRWGPRVLADAWRPGDWGMGQLCADALAQGVSHYRQVAAQQPPR
jgi:hypothetical protein